MLCDLLQETVSRTLRRPFFIQNSLARLEALRQQEVMPVFVSGSTSDFLAPIAEHLNVRYVLATELSTDHVGRYTGDHPSDTEFISLLGYGAMISGNPEAEKLAHESGWEVIPTDNRIQEVA